MTEKDTGIECPKCGRKIIDGGTDYKCEAGDFMCKKNMRGHEITLEELQKILEDGRSDELDFVAKDRHHYKGLLVLNAAKNGIDFKFPDSKSKDPAINKTADSKSDDTELHCPNCKNKIKDDGSTYQCESGDFKCQKTFRGHEITHEELQKVFEDGKSGELDFVAKDRHHYKGLLVLNEAKDGLNFKFPESKSKDPVINKPADSQSGDTGLHCPKCGNKIIDDGTNYKCEAGDFKCLKNIRDHEITREELQKVLIDCKSKELDFVDRDTGKPYKGLLVLNKAKNGIEFKFAKIRDRSADFVQSNSTMLIIVFVITVVATVIGLVSDLSSMSKSSVHSFEITLSDKKSAQKLEEFLDANVGKIVELTIHYKQNLVYGLVPWAKYSEDSYYGVKYDPAKDGSWWWDSASAAHDVTFSHFGDNNRFYVKSFLYDKNLFEVEYRDFGGIGYCDAITRYAYQLMIPYVKNDKLAFEWQRDREKSKDYVALPSPYWVLKGTFVVNVKKGEELTDNITTLYDEFQQRKLRSDYGKDYVVPEIAKILAVDPACGERTGNGDYSFSGKSFELEPLTQQQLLQMAYN